MLEAKWTECDDYKNIKYPCWATVEKDGERSVLLAINSDDFAYMPSIKLIAVAPIEFPKPYTIDLLEDGWLLPSKYEIKAYENECLAAKETGRPLPSVPVARPCKIVDRNLKMFGNPYTAVICEGHSIKTPSENVVTQEEYEKTNS